MMVRRITGCILNLKRNLVNLWIYSNKIWEYREGGGGGEKHEYLLFGFNVYVGVDKNDAALIAS